MGPRARGLTATRAYATGANRLKPMPHLTEIVFTIRTGGFSRGTASHWSLDSSTRLKPIFHSDAYPNETDRLEVRFHWG